MEATKSHKYTWEPIDANEQLQRYFYFYFDEQVMSGHSNGEIKGNEVF